MTPDQDLTPPRVDTAGEVDELEGDVDRLPEGSSLTTLTTGYETEPDQGGTPGDAAGESGDTGAGPR